jgi:hypothetical protein
LISLTYHKHLFLIQPLIRQNLQARFTFAEVKSGARGYRLENLFNRKGAEDAESFNEELSKSARPRRLPGEKPLHVNQAAALRVVVRL